MDKDIYKCSNCAKYEGDCGHHFRDTLGHLHYDCPAEGEYDGRWACDGPACFEPNEQLIQEEKKEKIDFLLKYYTEELLEEAISIMNNNDAPHKKLYRKMKRAAAVEVGDPHFKMGTKCYPWYYEEDFPENMEELVKTDNPFDGWYKYTVEEEYEKYGKSISSHLPATTANPPMPKVKPCKEA